MMTTFIQTGLRLSSRGEEKDVPVSEAKFVKYSTHEILSVDANFEQVGTEDIIAFGSFDIELTESGKLKAIECFLPADCWSTEMNFPSRKMLEEASSLDLSFVPYEMKESMPVGCFHDPSQDLWGICIVKEVSTVLLRVNRNVTVEVDLNEKVYAFWIENVTTVALD